MAVVGASGVTGPAYHVGLPVRGVRSWYKARHAEVVLRTTGSANHLGAGIWKFYGERRSEVSRGGPGGNILEVGSQKVLTALWALGPVASQVQRRIG